MILLEQHFFNNQVHVSILHTVKLKRKQHTLESEGMTHSATLGQIKNKSVSVNRSENSGRVDTHIFFLEKYIILCISPFRMHKIIFFQKT